MKKMNKKSTMQYLRANRDKYGLAGEAMYGIGRDDLGDWYMNIAEVYSAELVKMHGNTPRTKAGQKVAQKMFEREMQKLYPDAVELFA